MTRAYDRVEMNALRLSPKERNQLLRRLEVSLINDPIYSPTAIAEAWDQEAARRVVDLEAGRAELIPQEKVFDDLCKKIGKAKRRPLRRSRNAE